MTNHGDDEKFQRLVQRIAPRSKLLRAWELTGGVSAQVTALEIERPGGLTKRVIVRRHGDADLKQNPDVAADEFKLLQIVHSAGLAVPTPYHLDQSGEIFPMPYVVVEYIEGEPEFAPADLADTIRQLAAQLSRIHSVDHSRLELSFLPEQEKIIAAKLKERPARLDDSLDEGPIRDALELIWPPP